MTVQVGNIFYTSWGYDQTNVDYYLVIGVSPSGKTAKLREVAPMTVTDQGPYTETIPASTELAPNFVLEANRRWCVNCRGRIEISRYGETEGRLVHYNSNTTDCLDENGYPAGTKAKRCKPTIYTKRVREYDGKPVLSWNSYSNAYLWDGQPKYATGFGWGH